MTLFDTSVIIDARDPQSVFHDASRYTGAKEKFVDATKLREKYGIVMNHELAPGIRRTVAWYAKNYETVKDRRKFGDA